MRRSKSANALTVRLSLGSTLASISARGWLAVICAMLVAFAIVATSILATAPLRDQWRDEKPTRDSIFMYALLSPGTGACMRPAYQPMGAQLGRVLIKCP
jgi:hypothetical protein